MKYDTHNKNNKKENNENKHLNITNILLLLHHINKQKVII